MKVKELIELLKQVDGNLNVKVYSDMYSVTPRTVDIINDHESGEDIAIIWD